MTKYTDINLNNSKTGYDLEYDLDAVKNSIKNLFTIVPGSVPGKPWLGSPIHVYLFDNIGFFEERAIENSLKNTLLKYDPRVNLVGIKVESQPEYNSMYITVEYNVYIENREIFQSLDMSLSYNNLTSIKVRAA